MPVRDRTTRREVVTAGPTTAPIGATGKMTAVTAVSLTPRAMRRADVLRRMVEDIGATASRRPYLRLGLFAHA